MNDPKILVVDDNVSILKALRRLLHAERFETTVTQSPDEALELVARELYAVLLADYRMPGISGIHLLAKVREISPDTVRILLTGHAHVHAAIEAINRGAVYRFLTKPWNGEELRLTVREAIALHQLARQSKRQKPTGAHEETPADTGQIRSPDHAVQPNLTQSIRILGELVETHSPLIGSHSRRVAALCGEIGGQLQLQGDDLRLIVAAAELHDIGKMGIPASLWHQGEDALSPEDREIVRCHVIQGEAIAQMIPDLTTTAQLIRHHHESFDGRGYPTGLKGEAIPLGSRIIAAADAYDNQLNRGDIFQRPNPASALHFLQQHRASRFDPRVVAALTTCVCEGFLRRGEDTPVHLRAEDLREGMVLASDVCTVSGVLLLPKDTRLLAVHLTCIRKHRAADPVVVDRICVYQEPTPAPLLTPPGSL